MLPTADTHQEIPLACDMAAIPADQREVHFARAEHLFGEAVQERHELPDGYAFRFRADDYPHLAAFIANERLCCPFFRFGLELTPARGPIWLRITGGDGVKAFMQAEFTTE
jgi:hypothetical protein